MVNTPSLGDRLPATHPSAETLKLLRLRRSTTAAMLTGPGPSADQLQTILAIGTRVPDHRRVCPYRFMVFEGEARSEFGKVLSAAFKSQNPDADAAAINLEGDRFLRAPVVVAVVFAPKADHRTPIWEQTLTTGAACQNMLIAANASGFAAQWLTEWYAYDRQVLDALGLSGEEQVAGFIYIGSAREAPKERPRVDPETLVSSWTCR